MDSLLLLLLDEVNGAIVRGDGPSDGPEGCGFDISKVNRFLRLTGLRRKGSTFLSVLCIGEVVSVVVTCALDASKSPKSSTSVHFPALRGAKGVGLCLAV